MGKRGNAKGSISSITKGGRYKVQGKSVNGTNGTVPEAMRERFSERKREMRENAEMSVQ